MLAQAQILGLKYPYFLGLKFLIDFILSKQAWLEFIELLMAKVILTVFFTNNDFALDFYNFLRDSLSD